MSNHNYSQYSKNKRFEVENEPVETVSPVEEDVVETVVEETVAPVEETVEKVTLPETVVEETVALVEETVETVTLPETVTGVVVDCTKLNVRAKPSVTADPVCVLDAKSEVKINVSKSNDEWFSVCTATGIEGYCMRKFVKASL